MTITRFTLLISILLFTIACSTSNRPNFLRMSEEEIYIYNMNKPLMDKIYCFEEKQTSTFIRRRQCMTVEDYVYRLERAALVLDVLQPSTGRETLSGPRN